MDDNTDENASSGSQAKQTIELTEREKIELVKRELVAALNDTNDAQEAFESDQGAIADDINNQLKEDKKHEVTAGGDTHIEHVAYVPPLQDPLRKAVRYLEEHNILQLFQGITSGIIYQRPGDPIAYMADEIEKLQEAEKITQEEDQHGQSDISKIQDTSQISS